MFALIIDAETIPVCETGVTRFFAHTCTVIIRRAFFSITRAFAHAITMHEAVATICTEPRAADTGCALQGARAQFAHGLLRPANKLTSFTTRTIQIVGTPVDGIALLSYRAQWFANGSSIAIETGVAGSITRCSATLSIFR